MFETDALSPAGPRRGVPAALRTPGGSASSGAGAGGGGAGASLRSAPADIAVKGRIEYQSLIFLKRES